MMERDRFFTSDAGRRVRPDRPRSGTPLARGRAVAGRPARAGRRARPVRRDANTLKAIGPSSAPRSPRSWRSPHLAALAHYDHWAAVAAFAIATLALAGSAWVVSFATEQVGERLGPAATGLLQATLGNLPELFVVIFALRAGELAVAQSAIVGSLLRQRSLLVLGCRDRAARCARRRRRDALRPARAAATRRRCCWSASSSSCSSGSSLSSGDRREPSREDDLGARRGAPPRRLPGLGDPLRARRRAPRRRPAAAARIGLPARARPARRRGRRRGASCPTGSSTRSARRSTGSHISQAFAGLVIVAIAGNAVEHVAGVVLAARRQAATSRSRSSSTRSRRSPRSFSRRSC